MTTTSSKETPLPEMSKRELEMKFLELAESGKFDEIQETFGAEAVVVAKNRARLRNVKAEEIKNIPLLPPLSSLPASFFLHDLL